MERPKIGIGVCVKKDNKVLLGKRMGSHGSKTWCFPGGHLEFGETPFDTAKRETFEEAGISIKNLKEDIYTNDIFKTENKHYITLIITAEYESGEVKIMEPDKCEKWAWFSWNNLPEPLFIPMKNLIEKGFNPFK